MNYHKYSPVWCVLVSDNNLARLYVLQNPIHPIVLIVCNDLFSCVMQLDPEALILQMAPTIDHQCKAMLDFMKRYNWNQFTIVTSAIAGYDNFVQALRRQVILRKNFR